MDLDRDLVGVSRAVDADMMLRGYRAGAFPMAQYPGFYSWWSPQPRGVLPLDALRVSRSLRKSTGRLHITFDEDFEAVLRHCADPARPGGWIDDGLRRAYLELADRGLAHSVEARDGSGALVGGLFGVSVGGLFTGESMFHLVRDASKAALVALVEVLGRAGGEVLLDVQWLTDHLASLGAVEISREDYLRRLPALVDRPSAWERGR